MTSHLWSNVITTKLGYKLMQHTHDPHTIHYVYVMIGDKLTNNLTQDSL